MKKIILISTLVFFGSVLMAFSQKADSHGKFLVIKDEKDNVLCAIKKEVITSIDVMSTYNVSSSIHQEKDYSSNGFHEGLIIRTSELSGYTFKENVSSIAGVAINKEYNIGCGSKANKQRLILEILNEISN